MDSFGILFMFLFILKYLVVSVLVLIVGTVIYNKIKISIVKFLIMFIKAY